VSDAIFYYQHALKIKPDYVDAQCNLANALVQNGNLNEGIEHYQQALKSNPNSIIACNNLAYLLATCGDPLIRNELQAEKLAQRAVQLSEGNNPLILRTLAITYSKQGRFVEALATIKLALQKAEAQGNFNLSAALQKELESYQSNQPPSIEPSDK